VNANAAAMADPSFPYKQLIAKDFGKPSDAATGGIAELGTCGRRIFSI
jgi:hypothetical protein